MDTERHLDEVHRFFPEWSDELASGEVFVELRQNSYSAGGYAEEFGHVGDADGTPLIPRLAGEPTGRAQRLVKANGLHAGYPECPRPGDQDRSASGQISKSPHSQPQPAFRSGDQEHGGPGEISVIRVGQYRRTTHVRFAARIAALWVRIRARRRELGSII